MTNQLLVPAAVLFLSFSGLANAAAAASRDTRWVGTWATAPQPSRPGSVQTFQNQSVRLIVHTSIGGSKVRIKISNTFGDQPLQLGGAHIARRKAAAEIDPGTDRKLLFHGQPSATVPKGSRVVSDPVDLDVPALSDLAISMFFPEATAVTTAHTLAKQTSYISPENGDYTGAANFPAGKTIASWPFLTGVDVAAAARAASSAASIVAFGSSTTDGDGSEKDANHRWPDVLAERLQKSGGREAELGVLNLGIIGNRLLHDHRSPGQTGGPFEKTLVGYGGVLGESGLARFDRDVLSQAGVKYVILVLGINDILFPGSFTTLAEGPSAKDVIEGNRQLIARAHKKGIRAIGTTIPPFEGALFRTPSILFSTAENEALRQEINTWIRSTKEFDGIIDFDAAVRDPSHPTRILPAYDGDDHLHCNDAGYIATGNAVPLSLFQGGKK